MADSRPMPSTPDVTEQQSASQPEYGPSDPESSHNQDTQAPNEPAQSRLRSTIVKFRSLDVKSGNNGKSAEKAPTQAQAGRGQTAERGETSEKTSGESPSMGQRARRFFAKLGRPEISGDGLTPPTTATEWMDDGTLPTLEKSVSPGPQLATKEAHRLVKAMSTPHRLRRRLRKARSSQPSSGAQTPVSDTDSDSGLPQGEGGILSHLLKLQSAHLGLDTPAKTPPAMKEQNQDYFSYHEADGSHSGNLPGSGSSTPSRKRPKWYKKPEHHSTMSLVNAGLNLSVSTPKWKEEARKTREEELRITVHIAAIISRQRYLVILCRALMRFGAPSHRLEEYMTMTARILEVNAQFLYLPGFMIMSFDDPSTRTTEVKMVRQEQGLDLARLDATQDVYKSVLHDVMGVEEATQDLRDIMKRPPKYHKWLVIFVYGLASASVGPFAFQARPIDMPIIFFLGCLLGIMQLEFAPRSSLYANVFEVFATVLNSFLSRAFGSIRNGVVNGQQQYLFCFSALAQSSIALILPGFLVLNGSLELQSHQMIAGSIRMVYAIIYSLFIGYGITIGTTLYGLMDGKANPNTTCSGALIGGSEYVQKFPFVALYVIFAAIINQGKWKQVPIMMFIAVVGYVVNYWSNQKLNSNPELANTLSALAIGVLGNLYSRIWHGHAASAILPAIFVLVPSGLASSGSLVAGVASAAEVRGNLTSPTNSSSNSGSPVDTNSSTFDVGFGMIQVSIGITVGLFLAALVVYPLGKRRSGLFSF